MGRRILRADSGGPTLVYLEFLYRALEQEPTNVMVLVASGIEYLGLSRPQWANCMMRTSGSLGTIAVLEAVSLLATAAGATVTAEGFVNLLVRPGIAGSSLT